MEPDALLRQLQARKVAPTRATVTLAPEGKRIRVCVCVGAGCVDRGGVAAFAEIEELVAETGSLQISLERVGCSGQCDKAPVVQLLPTEAQRRARVLSADCADQSASAVNAALDMANACAARLDSPPRSGVDGLLHRRSANARWEALRALGRAHSGRARAAALEQLESALKAELHACKGDAARIARASRRAARFHARFGLAHENSHATPAGGCCEGLVKLEETR